MTSWPLERLDDGGVRAMIAEILGLRVPPADLCATIVAAAEGNPFYVCEYLRAAVASGVLVRTQGRWEPGAAGQVGLPMPGSIRSLVLSHLETLATHARAILEFAAVLGNDASTRILAASTGLSEEALMDGLHELVTRQLAERAPDGVWIAHDKVRQAAYDEIAPVRRSLMHGKAAAAIEACLPEHARPLHALARHWHEAGEIERARPLYLRASELAYERFAFADAEAHAALVLELSSRADPTSIAARFLMGRLVRRRGELPEGRALLAQALAEARGTGADELRASIIMVLADRAFEDGDRQEAHALLDECAALARDRGWPSVEANVQAVRSNFASDELRHTDALELNRSARRIFETAGDLKNVVRCVTGEAQFLLLMGKAREARAVAERGLELAAEGVPLTRARLLQLLALVDLDSGAAGRAVSELEEATGLAARCGDRRLEAEIRANLGVAHLLLGDVEAFRRELAAAEAQSRALGLVKTLAFVLAQQVDERRTKGDHDAARRHLAELLTVTAASPDVRARSEAGLVAGWLAHDDGDLAEARRRASVALDAGEASEDADLRSGALALLSAVERVEGRFAEALALSRRALEAAGDNGVARFFAHEQAALACLAMAQDATPDHECCRRIAAEIGAGPESCVVRSLETLEVVLAAEAGRLQVRGVLLELAPPGLRAYLEASDAAGHCT